MIVSSGWQQEREKRDQILVSNPVWAGIVNKLAMRHEKVSKEDPSPRLFVHAVEITELLLAELGKSRKAASGDWTGPAETVFGHVNFVML